MKEKNLENENLEDLERNEDLTSKSEDFIDEDIVDEDIVFEELNADGEEMSSTQKKKNEKEKLKEKFEDKIIRLEKERDEYLKGWQRIQADYKNREKEIGEEKKRNLEFANSNLIKEMLPVFDGYDMARANEEQWNSVDQNWRVGVEYLFSQLEKVLENHGMKSFGKIGDEYNPNLHEAIELVKLSKEDKKQNDKIVAVIQKGYKLGEKLIRPARVKVGRVEE